MTAPKDVKVHYHTSEPCKKEVCSFKSAVCSGAHGGWWVPGSRCAEATSHVRDLDAGVATDRASLASGWRVVSGLLGQGAVAAVTPGVPPAARFRAEPCWRLGS